MPIPKDTKLLEKAKEIANNTYNKPSAYKSGFIVKKYKELYKDKYGSENAYKDDGKEKNLKRWYNEKWTNLSIGGYPTYRPTVRINKNTPKTVSEISDKRIKEQIVLKQKIKGNKNLPKF